MPNSRASAKVRHAGRSLRMQRDQYKAQVTGMGQYIMYTNQQLTKLFGMLNQNYPGWQEAMRGYQLACDASTEGQDIKDSPEPRRDQAAVPDDGLVACGPITERNPEGQEERQLNLPWDSEDQVQVPSP